MELQESTWSEYKLPCPKCGGSDPVAKNKNGSAKCFSCVTFFSSYEEAIEGKVMQKNNNYKKGSTFLSSNTGVFGSLMDRGISETVAKKYGVRIVYNNSGEIAQHIYPYYNGNEIVGTKRIGIGHCANVGTMSLLGISELSHQQQPR